MDRTSKMLMLVVVFLIGAFCSSALGAGIIDSELAYKLETLAPQEFVRVIIRMEDETPLITNAMGPSIVHGLLQETAARSQAPVLSYLANQRPNGVVAGYNGFWIANVVFAEVQAQIVPQLAALPGVAYIYEDFQIEHMNSADGEKLSDPVWWDHIGATFAPEVWEMGIRGQGVTVAVVDSGVDITHPELQGAMGGIPPFYEGYWAEFDADGYFVPGSIPHDTSTGTHSCGTVLGRNVAVHRVGMAPEATLAHVLVLPHGGGTLPQAFAGLQWIVEQRFPVAVGSFAAGFLYAGTSW